MNREEPTGRGWRMVDGSGWFYVKHAKDGVCGAFTKDHLLSIRSHLFLGFFVVEIIVMPILNKH